MTISVRNEMCARILKRKRERKQRKMPTELLNDFIGKNCTISMLNELGSTQGRILEVKGNWIKIEEKKKIRIINGDMIRDISIAK